MTRRSGTDVLLALVVITLSLVAAAIAGDPSWVGWAAAVGVLVLAVRLTAATQAAEPVQALETELDVPHEPHRAVAAADVFDASIAAEVRRSRRTGRAVSIVLCEVDSFGELDHRHGAGAADEALNQVGGLLRSSAREIDLVAQIAADQFGILLPETTTHAAALVAERLRTAIARWSPQAGVPLTASFGVAGWIDEEDVFDEALGALAEARRQGRDRVVVAGEDDLAS